MALQPPGATVPLAYNCSVPGVVCVTNNAASMPYPFYRSSVPDSSGSVPVYGSTSVPSDPSWSSVSGADFLVFDEQRGLELLGANPRYEFVFETSKAVHEAPAFVPSLNQIFLSMLAPPPGYLPQLIIDLNNEPPTLEEFISDPPVYAPNGGTFANGLIYWGASGSNASIGGTTQRPGVRTLDPATNKTTTLLNNYGGYYFNTVDDLFVDPCTGYVWFTDPDYSWWNGLADVAPQLPPASYRFDPRTGSTVVVESTIHQPNGIALSPNRKHVYISDSNAVGANTPISPYLPGGRGTDFNATSSRYIYKFDLVDDGRALVNKRPIYLSAIGTVPDGLKVAQNGYVVAGTGSGVDVMDSHGQLLVRIQTNYTVQNFVWASGGNYTDFWMMGQGGISRVQWALQGQELH